MKRGGLLITTMATALLLGSGVALLSASGRWRRRSSTRT
jgi:hypothetical protein